MEPDNFETLTVIFGVKITDVGNGVLAVEAPEGPEIQEHNLAPKVSQREWLAIDPVLELSKLRRVVGLRHIEVDRSDGFGRLFCTCCCAGGRLFGAGCSGPDWCGIGGGETGATDDDRPEHNGTEHAAEKNR